MNDNENKKKNEELTDEALDEVTGGLGMQEATQDAVASLFSDEGVCNNCKKVKPLKFYPVGYTVIRYCADCARSLGLLQ